MSPSIPAQPSTVLVLRTLKDCRAIIERRENSMPGGRPRRELYRPRSGGFIARGSPVDELPRIEALRPGKILAAGLDMCETRLTSPNELVALDNAVLLPHLGRRGPSRGGAMAGILPGSLVGKGG